MTGWAVASPGTSGEAAFSVPKIELMQCYSLFKGFYTLKFNGESGDVTNSFAAMNATPLPGQKINEDYEDKDGNFILTRYFDWRTPWLSEGVDVKGFNGRNVLGVDQGIPNK